MPVASIDALVSFAVWWGPRVEIVDPPEARSRVMERVARFAS